MATEKPEYANAVWWDCSSVYVRCPDCEKIHHHGFEHGDYTRTHRRLAHCYRRTHINYEIRFPFNIATREAGFEIDKERVLFVAGGADPAEYFAESKDRQLPSLVPDFSDQLKWTDATETVQFPEEESGIPGGYSSPRIDLVLSAMIRGKIECVRDYLKTSNDADIFLHGVESWKIPRRPWGDEGDDGEENDEANDEVCSKEDSTGTNGNTALHFAACEGFPDIVRLLLEYGANPNVLNDQGRTPLAEAALWGRRENVELLLGQGAQKEMDCYLNNGRRGKAIDFAKPLDFNKEKRHSRAGGDVQIYKEDTFRRDQDRKAIMRLLQGQQDELAQVRSDIVGFAFTRSPLTENLMTLVAHFDIPNKCKTVGVLYRGGPFPTVGAMSGWSHLKGREPNVKIAGRDWTPEVMRLCEHIGHGLPADNRDQGDPGRFNACHAEKQLVAYFVRKHRFLPHETLLYEAPSQGKEGDLAGLASGLSLEGASLDSAEQAESLYALKCREPPVSLKTATVLVCRPICDDCEKFVRRVNDCLGLDITMFHNCREKQCPSCKDKVAPRGSVV